MSVLTLVRHGQATAGWGEDMDPGLSALGWQQAANMAETLAPLGPMPIVTSPLARTQETAQAFETMWPNTPIIDPRIAEVPSPSEILEVRRAWLTDLMAGRWSDPAAQKAGPHDLAAWHRGVIQAVLEREQDTVFTSHFVAINVVVGHIMGDDRLVYFRPDNCSVTVIELENGSLRVVELGKEAETEVN